MKNKHTYCTEFMCMYNGDGGKDTCVKDEKWYSCAHNCQPSLNDLREVKFMGLMIKTHRKNSTATYVQCIVLYSIYEMLHQFTVQ